MAVCDIYTRIDRLPRTTVELFSGVERIMGAKAKFR